MRVSVAILLLSLAACADEEPTAAPRSTTTSTTAAPSAAVTVDWTKRVPETDLGNGWSIASCEGDAPLLCLEKDGTAQGILERAEFPLSSLRYATADDMATLRAHAQDYYRSFVDDRAKGCGREYEMRAIEPEEVEVAGRRGLRYGFAGNRPGEKPSERHLNHALVKDGQLVILTLPAYDENACMAREQELTTATQAEVEPLLPPLLAGMRLP